MPKEKGSILNEEYTKKVEKIHALLKEATDIYASLPECLKSVKTKHQASGGNSLGWYLINGEAAASCFADEFGIEVKR